MYNMGRGLRRLRRAIKDFPLERMLEGHYSYAWVGDDDSGGVKRGKFHVWGEGGVMHPDLADCTCSDLDGPIGEKNHPLVERYDYRNRADYWRRLVADWYHVNLGELGRVYLGEDKQPVWPNPNRLDRVMDWLVGKPFAMNDRVRAPHRSKDSIYEHQRG